MTPVEAACRKVRCRRCQAGTNLPCRNPVGAPLTVAHGYRFTDATAAGLLPLPVEAAPMSCPSCSALLDAHESIDDDPNLRPGEGDASVCWHCGELAVYVAVAGVLILARPTPAERAKLVTEPDIAAAMAGVRRGGNVYAAVSILRGRS